MCYKTGQFYLSTTFADGVAAPCGTAGEDSNEVQVLSGDTPVR